MKSMKWKVALLAATAAAVLVGCGGGSSGGDQQLRVSYSSLVSFGDSLSDVGTYQVGGVVVMGGGKYTINSSTDKNWTELIAAQMGLAAPCPAQKGLDGSAAYGFSVPVVNTAACLNYAQGGARVTNPVGPGNKLLGGSNATIGQLTVPIVTQILNHLTKVNNKFSGTELVTVMAGANDVFIQLATVSATVSAAQTAGAAAAADPTNAVKAATATAYATAAAGAPQAAVVAMGTAGAELAGYIKSWIVGKGATKVLVLNIPDVKGTPFGKSTDASTQGLIDLMVTTFNDQLKAGLKDQPGVLLVDAYTASKDETANPAQYGITNATTPACILDNPSKNALGSSLVCNANNVIAGDVSKYLFADTVHPSPYGYQLIAQLVAKELTLAKWF
jgi:phospholipase/lecithinase/hemolysin